MTTPENSHYSRVNEPKFRSSILSQRAQSQEGVHGEILPELRCANLRSPGRGKASRILVLNYSSVGSAVTIRKIYHETHE
jgi:hypothetical protein